MQLKRILVIGGAGYIGSHMVRQLQQTNYFPVVLDDLSTGHRQSIGNETPFIKGSLSDTDLLNAIFQQYQFHAVMHFASFIQVDESVKQPIKYYQNNFVNTLNLLAAMHRHQVNKFIFSSSAAVYGEPLYTPIDEKHPLAPINPYGQSKYMVEQALADIHKAHGLQYAALRYFNAAGADPSGHLCEQHEPETHLIPLLLQTAMGMRDHVQVYGRDYPTPDGTCVRDYVHVNDLCRAHLLALQALEESVGACVYNLGTGEGYSVQQVIDKVRQVTQCEIPVVYQDRRTGDPAVLIADPRRAIDELGWRPEFSDLETIVRHTWQAFRKRSVTIQAKSIV